MTKKSPARLMRDAQAAEARRQAQAPENHAWTELLQRYNECVNLLKAHLTISVFAQCQVLLNELNDKQGFASSARAMGNDIRSLRAKLAEILALHQTRTGSATPDEIQYTIEVNEEYMKWISLHSGTVMPLAQDLTVQIIEAEVSLNTKGIFLMIDGTNGVVVGTREQIEGLVARRNAGDFGPVNFDAPAPAPVQAPADSLGEAQTLRPTEDLASKTNQREVTDLAVN